MEIRTQTGAAGADVQLLPVGMATPPAQAWIATLGCSAGTGGSYQASLTRPCPTHHPKKHMNPAAKRQNNWQNNASHATPNSAPAATRMCTAASNKAKQQVEQPYMQLLATCCNLAATWMCAAASNKAKQQVEQCLLLYATSCNAQPSACCNMDARQAAKQVLQCRSVTA